MSNLRISLLAFGLMLAAAPLLWMDLDPRAGEKLLRWTGQKQAQQVASMTPQQALR
ncbi:MAG: hypothetical protein JNK75_07670 [Betaproteobacteria bacterium]|nr:hypothetical protein [Betaproteobacteria bacterium]